MSNVLQSIADTISQKPEVGIFGSILGVALSPIMIISLFSAIFGLLVTVVTLTIKIIDLVAKINERKRYKRIIQDDVEIVVVGDKKYQRIEE